MSGWERACGRCRRTARGFTGFRWGDNATRTIVAELQRRSPGIGIVISSTTILARGAGAVSAADGVPVSGFSFRSGRAETRAADGDRAWSWHLADLLEVAGRTAYRGDRQRRITHERAQRFAIRSFAAARRMFRALDQRRMKRMPSGFASRGGGAGRSYGSVSMTRRTCRIGSRVRSSLPKR